MNDGKPTQRAIDDGPWLWSAKEAFSRAFKAGGKEGLALYFTLALLESDAPKRFKHRFAADLGTLSRMSGVGRRKIQELLREFERLHIIKVWKPSGVRRLKHGSSEFTLLKTYAQNADRPKKDSPKSTATPSPDSTKTTCPGTRPSHSPEVPISIVKKAPPIKLKKTALLTQVSAMADRVGDSTGAPGGSRRATHPPQAKESQKPAAQTSARPKQSYYAEAMAAMRAAMANQQNAPFTEDPFFTDDH